MNKKLNIIIFSLLILTIWVIFSIGIGFIPLINFSLFPIDTNIKINTCLLNLAYSYLAGFIMYIFTVIIPYNNRKKINLGIINQYIQRYCYSSSGTFIVCCCKFKLIDISEAPAQPAQPQMPGH